MDVVNTGLLTASLRSDEMLITARGQFAVGLLRTGSWRKVFDPTNRNV